MTFKIQPRIIPILNLKEDSLIKTKKFIEKIYLGDALNTVRVLNDLDVDELIFLDIYSSRLSKKINFHMIEKIASECFMPLTYGGGVKNFEDIKTLFSIGIEKISFNSLIFEDFNTFAKVCDTYGAQSVIASIDLIEEDNNFEIFIKNATQKIELSLEEIIKKLNNLGVGELLITDINREGMRCGYNFNLIKKISSLTNLPIIINGGADSYEDFKKAFKCGATGMGASSLFTINKSFETLMINYPTDEEKEEMFS